MTSIWNSLFLKGPLLKQLSPIDVKGIKMANDKEYLKILVKWLVSLRVCIWLSWDSGFQEGQPQQCSNLLNLFGLFPDLEETRGPSKWRGILHLAFYNKRKYCDRFNMVPRFWCWFICLSCSSCKQWSYARYLAESY